MEPVPLRLRRRGISMFAESAASNRNACSKFASASPRNRSAPRNDTLFIAFVLDYHMQLQYAYIQKSPKYIQF